MNIILNELPDNKKKLWIYDEEPELFSKYSQIHHVIPNVILNEIPKVIPNEIPNEILNRKVFDNKIYKIYLRTIFDYDRHLFRISQDNVFEEDLKQMRLADKAYENNPKEFKFNDFKSYPDILRCTFIIKHKHRYYRCKNKVINDDNDICKKHENVENIYIDKYNDLLTQYEQSPTDK